MAGRKDFGKDGKKTQIKAGTPEAREFARKGALARNSIRANMRRLAAFEPAVDDNGKPIMSMRALKQAFGSDTKGKRLNVAEICAITSVAQGLQDFRAMRDVIENVDGKQADKTINAEVTYAEMIAGVDNPDDEA